MENFSLEKWLQDKSRKVVTRDRRPVRIICWDAPTKKPIYGFVEGDDWIKSWGKDGRFSNSIDYDDLFFADEEKELTEFEKHVQSVMMNCGLVGCTKSYKDIDAVKATSKHLLDLTRKEIQQDIYDNGYRMGYELGKQDALKSLPKWRKGNDGEFLYETSIVWTHDETKTFAAAGLRMDSNTLYIPISELEKLQKEE